MSATTRQPDALAGADFAGGTLLCLLEALEHLGQDWPWAWTAQGLSLERCDDTYAALGRVTLPAAVLGGYYCLRDTTLQVPQAELCAALRHPAAVRSCVSLHVLQPAGDADPVLLVNFCPREDPATADAQLPRATVRVLCKKPGCPYLTPSDIDGFELEAPARELGETLCFLHGGGGGDDDGATMLHLTMRDGVAVLETEGGLNKITYDKGRAVGAVEAQVARAAVRLDYLRSGWEVAAALAGTARLRVPCREGLVLLELDLTGHSVAGGTLQLWLGSPPPAPGCLSTRLPRKRVRESADSSEEGPSKRQRGGGGTV